MKAWVFLMGAIVSEVIATAALKSSLGFTNLSVSYTHLTLPTKRIV